MTKQRSTKRALLLSALSLLMCVSMLIGSTFAWFTDSVTSGNNKIVAGNLDIELWMHNGTEYVNISESENPIFGAGSIAQNNNAETLWEPGKTQVAYLQIKNNGNLALKYTVGLDVENVSKDLYKVMQYAVTPDATAEEPVTAWDAAKGNSVVLGTQAVTNGDTVMKPGDVHSFALSIHMDEKAGNEYQGGQVNFDLTVMATQATVESDSFDDQYDANATNPAIVRSADELKDALAAGGNVMLGTNIAVDGNISLKAGATLNGNGYTLTDAQLYMAEDSTVKNVKFDGVESANGSNIYAHGVSATIDGCTFDSADWEAIQATTTVPNVTTTVTNCTFRNTRGLAYRYVHVEVADKELRKDVNNGVSLVMTNNYFENIDTCDEDAITVVGVVENNLTVSGNTASAASVDAAKNECWFGYVGVVDGKNTWIRYYPEAFAVVVNVDNAEDLANALAEGNDVVLSEDVEMEAAATAPYGNKYGVALNGGVLDGNGNELEIECYGDDYGIMTTGGTIKNLTIKEGCRAVMIMYATEDIILDNVNIGGDGVLYTINTGEVGPNGSAGIDLIVTNSTIKGWTSYGDAVESASFTNVSFGQGTYYNNIYGRVLKPYVNTTLTDCSFIEHMNLDLSALAEGHKVTIENCTVNGQAVTADVFTVPATDAEYETELFTVDLPSWADSISDCIIFK